MSGYWGGKVTAPFTPAQVDSLNSYQASGIFHEFTCGNDQCRGLSDRRVLYAREDGWHCQSCDYTQDWAHGAMADWSWNVPRQAFRA